MSKNVGKLFEEDFIASVPEDVFKFRFRDLPYFLTKNSKYTVNNNPADFFIFYDYLYILELKSCKGTSYPMTNTRKNQVEGLTKYSKCDKVLAGFVINYRKYNKTYFIHIDDYIIISKHKKSINIKDMELYGKLIEQNLKRVRYSYNIKKFINYKEDGC